MTLSSQNELIVDYVKTIQPLITKPKDGYVDQFIDINRFLALPEKSSVNHYYKNWEYLYEGPQYHTRLYFTSHSENQLLQMLKIPAAYLHRCPPKLETANFNYWTKSTNKVILCRFSPNNRVRAIVSTKYNTQMDDRFILESVLKAFNHVLLEHQYSQLQTDFDEPHINPEVKISSFKQDEMITSLSIHLYGFKAVYENKEFYPGITIINSEVGSSSFYIRPSLIIYRDTHNTEYTDNSNEGVFYKVHLGSQSPTEQQLTDAIHYALRCSQAGIVHFIKLMQEKIEKPEKEIQLITEEIRDIVTEQILGFIEDEAKKYLALSKYRLSLIVKEAVNDLPVFKQHEVDKRIGRYLELFQDTDQRLQEIIQLM